MEITLDENDRRELSDAKIMQELELKVEQFSRENMDLQIQIKKVE